MRILKWISLLSLLPALSWATWQVSNTKQPLNLKNPYTSAARGKTNYANEYNDTYVFDIEKNNLKWNVFKNAKKYKWQVSWHAVQKYPVLSSDQIAGPTFCVTLGRLLEHYPALKFKCNLAAKKVSIYSSNYPFHKVFKYSYSK